MMPRRGVLGLLGALAGSAVLGGCGPSGSASYRFRMTVEADTREGLRSGSSVVEVIAETQERFVAQARPLISTLRGEAVMVDTPGGPVFALLRLPHGERTFLQAVTFALAPDLREGGWEPFLEAVQRLGGWFGSATAELPREDWPLTVRFRDLADSTSVERVEPEAVGIRRIVVETTRDPVTQGIEKRLGWLSSQRGSLVKRPPANFSLNPPIGYQLTEMDFSTEMANVA